MADSLESRLLRVERDVAVLGQRVEDIAASLTHLATLPIAMAVAQEGIRGCGEDIQAVRLMVDGIIATMKQRDEQATGERKSMRVALIALTGVIFAALIAAVATIVAAGVAG